MFTRNIRLRTKFVGSYEVCTSNFPGNLSHLGPETESLYWFYRPTLNFERKLPICVDRCH